MSRQDAWQKDIRETTGLISDIFIAASGKVISRRAQKLIQNAIERLVDNVIAVEGKQDASSNTRNGNNA